MTPSFSFGNTANGLPVNLVREGYFDMGHLSFAVNAADFDNFEFCELGSSMLFALALATLFYLIRRILSISTKKQMAWINAPRIVAAMTYKHTVRDRSKVQFIGKSMRLDQYAFSDANLTIAKIVAVALPLPARVGLFPINLIPESNSGRWVKLFFGTMTKNKSYGLTFDVPQFPHGLFCEWSRLAAATFAKFNGGVLRGMIHDVTRSFQRLTMPRDTRNVAVALLLVDFIIPQIGGG